MRGTVLITLLGASPHCERVLFEVKFAALRVARPKPKGFGYVSGVRGVEGW